MNIEGKPHTIIENPHEYEIVEFHYNCSSADILEHFIDLYLHKEGTRRELRFMGARNLKIEEGFPRPTRGMAILDTSACRLEDIGVDVSDWEASFGAITFVARSVIDLDNNNK